MSLDQLTANYTDSEGEDDEHTSIGDSSHKSSPMISRISDLKDDHGSRKATPISVHSVESGTNTPVKKLSRLVSYANEDDDDEGEDIDRDDDEEPDEELNSEPMDTGSDEEEEKSKSKNLGIKLPLPPPGKCAAHLQEKVVKFMNEVRHGNKDYNAMYQNKKEFRNPGIYEKLIEHLQLDEMGTNYPLDMFDPHCWGKESYYDDLARVQKEEMDKREKERKEKSKNRMPGIQTRFISKPPEIPETQKVILALQTSFIGKLPEIPELPKVDIVSGTKKPVEEERKRKSRFDQCGPSNSIMKQMVAPPTLTSVPSGTKTAIDAFGTLKKTK